MAFFALRYTQNKLHRCHDCHRMIPRRNICILSISIEDQTKNKSLCQNCIRPHVEKGFKYFKYKAVMVHPDKKFNAYQFYTFSEFPKYGADAEYISKLKQALPTDNQRCSHCDSTANFSWCGHDFFKNNLYTADIELNAPKQMLCGACLAKAFIALLEIKQITLGQFIAPYDGVGLGKPWEY